MENPGHAQWYIDEEVSAGRLRPIPAAEGHLAHWSPIGMVPKDHRPGEFRLIIDLSASMGGSVNEGIGPNLTSLTYPRVEDAVRFVKAAGPGASMAKLDLKAAYRHVPVHPDDQSLLAIRWGGTTYLDTVSRSAYAPPPSCSLLWPMALLGVSCVKGSPISFITWMAFLLPH